MSESSPPELHTSYEALVMSHRAALARLARQLAGNVDDAEDLLQETLIDAYRAFSNFRPGSHFYGWVARIMRNNHLDRRRRKRHLTVSLDGADPTGAPEAMNFPDNSANPESLLLEETFDFPLQSALDSLQPVHRSAVLLCDVEGASYEEAARAEACPIGTIRSRLHRAHKALREFLSSLDPREPPNAAAAPPRVTSRRSFLVGTAAAAGAALTQWHGPDEAAADAEPVRVLVWSEGGAPKDVYPGEVHGAIADGLRADRRLEVLTGSLADAEQGLSDEVLRKVDVLVWWGSQKHEAVRDDRVAAVVRRVRDGTMGLIAVHSASESRPLRALLGEEWRWKGEASVEGRPIDLRLTAPRHPISRDLESFRVPKTERASGEYEGPQPDVVVFDGTHPGGGRSVRQGMVWTVGRGRVFYFAPGHEAYPVFFQEEVRKVLLNAVHWCAGR